MDPFLAAVWGAFVNAVVNLNAADVNLNIDAGEFGNGRAFQNILKLVSQYRKSKKHRCSQN